MTDDANNSTRPDPVVDRPERTEQMTRSDWESLSTDPDDETDLGYQFTEWEQFETLEDTDQVIFLPSDETALADAAFVVAGEGSVTDLDMHR